MSDSATKRLQQQNSAVIVEGEAPESDDDDERAIDEAVAAASNASTENSIPVKTTTATTATTPKQQPQQQQQRAAAAATGSRRYQGSLLHAKFFQDAAQFQAALVARRAATYDAAAKELRSVTGQLAKTHAYIQEVSHTLRLTTNDLYKLEDRLQAVQKTNWLVGL